MAPEVIEAAHGDAKARPVCEECGRDFANRGAMLAHSMVHRRDNGDEPKAAKSDRAPRVTPAKAPISNTSLEEQLVAFHMLVAVGAQMLGYPRTGAALAQQAPAAAKAAVAWGSTNPMVRRGLEMMLAGGGGALLLAAYIPVAMTFAEEVREKKFGPIVVDNGQVPDGAVTAEGPFGETVPGGGDFAYTGAAPAPY